MLLTRPQLFKFLEMHVLSVNIRKTLKSVFAPFMEGNYFQNRFHTSFQIFGVDVEPDQALNVKVLEVNKDPDLKPKDANRDGKLKSVLQRQLFGMVFTNEPAFPLEYDGEDRFVPLYPVIK